jgi:PKD repeat protein
MEQAGTVVLAVERFGVKVYATVGRGERQGEISRIEVRGLSPLWLEIKFANTGTVNLGSVAGWVEIYDAQGSLLDRFDLEAFPSLPGSERWVRVETGLRPSPGTYLVMAVVDIGAEALFAGRRSLRISPLALEPLTETEKLPKDLDGDGFYEDINGDGVFDAVDVMTFLEFFDRPAIQQNWRAFDFNNDGVVDWDDVFQLQGMLGY